jgi:hypothetical protein
MTMGWETAKDLSKKHAESGGLFVQLKDHGDKIAGVFCGEPYAREVVWDEEDGYTPYEPNGKHAGQRASLRVALNFFVPADGGMKIIEGGSQWFKSILAVRAKFPLDHWSVEIERQGAARNPKTTYTVLPHEQLDAATRAKIAAMPLHDLERVLQGNGEFGGEQASSPAAPAATPIDQGLALKIVERLKQLPRTATEEFLKELGIARIRDITTAKLAQAERFLSQLETAHRPADVDPFA